MLKDFIFLNDIFKIQDKDIKIENLCKKEGKDHPVAKVCYSLNDHILRLLPLGMPSESAWNVLYDPDSVGLDYDDLFLVLKHASTIEELKEYENLLIRLIPGYERMIGYDQNNRYHQYTLEDHSLHTVLNLPKNTKDNMLYFAALIHDVGKPDARCKGKNPEDTQSHYYNHPEKSYEFTKNSIIPFMKEHGYEFKKNETERLLYYVRYHDDQLSLKPKHLLKHLKI